MKKRLALLLALVFLTGCGAPQTDSPSGSSSAPSGSSSQSSSAPSSSEETPIPDHSAQESSSSLADENPSADQPAKEPLPQRYTSTAPAEQSWSTAYDTFYCGITRSPLNPEPLPIENPFSEEAVVRGQLIFPVFSYGEDGCRGELLAFADLVKECQGSGPILEKFQQLSSWFGAVLETPQGAYYGEALGQIQDEKAALVEMTQHTQGSYDYRFSMTITQGVEAQLLDRGFSPATTSARALWINGYTTGTFFRDGERCCFLNQSVGIPTFDVLESGRIYTMEELAADITARIDILAPEAPEAPESPGKTNPSTAKPVIYLYPQQETQVTVSLDYPGPFTYTYPTYQDGWQVTAYPDGRLVNRADGSEHYYLFWEGDEPVDWDLTQGFVVKGADTESFLREKLAFLGLTPREYNDFITYWVPEMQQNPYNLISFATTQYEELAPLTVSPAPDSQLRVHMVYKACPADTKVAPQTLTPFTRSGFTVVEWGGSRAR